MRSDSEIKRDVEDELKWDPDINADEVAVSVKGGVVTLTGFLRSYGQKFGAERAAMRVNGVSAVANDIEVRLPAIDQRPDPDVARDVVSALKNELPYTAERIKATVTNGWVTLQGEVEWNYQRDRAASAARRVRSVKGVTNSIKLKPLATPTEIKHKIEAAFKRSAEIDANKITVEANRGDVVLHGSVRSTRVFDRSPVYRRTSIPSCCFVATWSRCSPTSSGPQRRRDRAGRRPAGCRAPS